MIELDKGQYHLRVARDGDDLLAAQRLRHRVFFAKDEEEANNPGLAIDNDEFDPICRHILIEEKANGKLVSTFRLLFLTSGAEIEKSYSAQFYNLSKLQFFQGVIVEMGRFCVAPENRDPEILRVAWMALTRLVDSEKIDLLFGCSSFSGNDPTLHKESLALLKTRYQAPEKWNPAPKANEIFKLDALADQKTDMQKAMRGIPPLLKSYLTLGGWVSDHAVIDRSLNTLHVFTGLEIQAISEARKRMLRASAL